MKRLLALLSTVALLASPTLFTGCSRGSIYDEMSGAEIYMRLCKQCHGPEGRAPTGVGNTYVNKRDLWTAETLLLYLDNPGGYKRKVPHLKSSKKYMPPLSRSVSPEARQRLVEHVLSQMESLSSSG